MAVDKVILASPRGFCAGVEKAINALAWMVRVFPPPVYCYHEIVHNQLVVEAFTRVGVIFVSDISEVPEGAPIMLSAHGSAPEVVEAAREHGGTVIDAVCPLVTKVHHEIRTRASKGYRIVYIGHRGHEEAIGATSEAPESVDFVETIADVEALVEDDRPIALLAQTTLAVPEWQELADRTKERLGDVWMPGRSDLCYATTNRQAAIASIAPRVDTLVVIGSANSSNTRALERVARSEGIRRVLRINSEAELPDDISGVVGITAGASAAEDVVAKVVERLHPREGSEIVSAVTEDEFFPAPPELRELLTGLSAATALLLERESPTEVGLHDSARDALAELAVEPDWDHGTATL
ncbi:MAG: 4-hydroxy-3-methylbut-2-enyl diphosphate reductase [Actinobacteria bacterium]|nr:4-hydroxy-3-methylbut-2-enyl diphosphate reductase [Actinomycetota bacterium]